MVSSSSVLPRSRPGVAWQILQQRRERLIPLQALRVDVLRPRPVVDAGVEVPRTVAADRLRDVHEPRAGVGLDQVLRQHEAVAQLVAAVAIALGVVHLEHRRPARVGDDAVGVLVEDLVRRDIAAERGVADVGDVRQLLPHLPASLELRPRRGIAATKDVEDERRVEIDAGALIGQESRADEPRRVARQVRAHVGREGVCRPALRLELVGDDAAEAGDLLRDRRVDRAARLHAVLAGQVNQLAPEHRADEAAAVDEPRVDQLREERLREIEVVPDALRIEILRRHLGFFEVPAVHRRDGAAHLDHDGVARRARRLRPALRVDLERADGRDERARGGHAGPLQKIATAERKDLE